jgi:hypothetical protein
VYHAGGERRTEFYHKGTEDTENGHKGFHIASEIQGKVVKQEEGGIAERMFGVKG